MSKGFKGSFFNNKIRSVRYKLTGLLMVVPILLSGCGSSKMDPLVQPGEVAQVVSQKNTVVVENEELNLYEGCEVEIHVIEKKPMTFQGACAALQKFENSGVWEGNLDEMRECRG